MAKVLLIAVAFLTTVLLLWTPVPSDAQKVKRWGDWTDWSECPVTCGGGQVVRIRRCTTPEMKGRCIRTRRRQCARQRCPTADPGDVTDVPDKTTKTPQPATVTTSPVKAEATAPIATPEDVKEMTQWGEWSACEAPCGGGKRYRTRECIDPSAELECEVAEEGSCNTQPCSADIPTGEPGITDSDDDPKPTPEGTPYSEPEGVPEQKPERPVLEGAPEAEPGKEKYVKPEPEGDSNVKDLTAWGEWSVCEAACGGGKRYRIRECTDPSAKLECEVVEEDSCNTQPCSPGIPTGEPGITDSDGDPKPKPEGDSYPEPEDIPDVKKEKPIGGGAPKAKPEKENYGEPERKDPEATPEGTPYPEPEGSPEQKTEKLIEEGAPETKPEMEDQGQPEPVGDSYRKDLTLWGEWSACDAPCGGGRRYRTRECIDPNEKLECEVAEEGACNTQPCSADIPTGEPGVSDSDDDPKPTPEGAPYSEPEGVPEQKPRKLVEEGVPETKPEKENYVKPEPEGDSDGKDAKATPEGTSDYLEPEGSADGETFTDEDIVKDYYDEYYDETTAGPDVDETTASGMGEDTEDETTVTETTTAIVTPSTVTTTGMVSAKDLCGDPKIEASLYVYNIVVSPGYPNNYPGGLDCLWTMSAPENARVQIVIDQFQAALGDRFTILEGRPRELPYTEARIVTLTKTVQPRAMFSSVGQHMTVRLQTRKNTEGGRYSFRLKAIMNEVEVEPDEEEEDEQEEDGYLLLQLLLTFLFGD